VVLFLRRIHETDRWSPWLRGILGGRGEKGDGEVVIKSSGAQRKKSIISYTVSSSLCFSVMNCATGNIIKGKISLTIMGFVLV